MVSVFIASSAIVGLVVMLHYEFLYRLTLRMPTMHIKHRFRIVLGVFTALITWTASFLYLEMQRHWNAE